MIVASTMVPPDTVNSRKASCWFIRANVIGVKSVGGA